MNITFTSDLRTMTYEHYLIQHKQMIEWVLKKNFYTNPELKKTFKNKSHRLIRKNKNMFPHRRKSRSHINHFKESYKNK